MPNIGYKNLLIQYIETQEPDQPILTSRIAQYVAKITGLDETVVKKAVNVNMARLEKTDKIIRVGKGVYCKKIETPFGCYTPNKEMIFCKQLLYDEDDVIGYETGLSALNRIGLVSQMPKRKCIATNLYTKRVPAGIQIETRKPSTNINRLNYRYLQMLDVIREMDNAPVDAVKPEELLKGTIKELGLDTDILILMARKYYNPKILIKTIDIMLEGLYETAHG